MRNISMIVGVLIGLLLTLAAIGAQGAESAKPENPSFFGQVVADEAVTLRTVGQNVSDQAVLTELGVSDEILFFMELFGGRPNPPNTNANTNSGVASQTD